MKAILLVKLFFIISSFNFINAQLIDSSNFEKVRVQQEPFFNYKDERGHPVGCSSNLECSAMNIAFYSIMLDKKNRCIKIRGRIYTNTIGKDTIGVEGATVFVAQPIKKRLKKAPKIFTYSYIRTSEDKKQNIFPYRKGDFEINFSLPPKHRLYFADSRHYLIEYDINKLLK